MAHHFPQTAEILDREMVAATGHQLTQSLDDAALLHVSGRSGVAGTYQGPEAILQLLEHMTNLTDGTLRFVPTHTFAADDEMLVVCGQANAQRQRRQLDTGTAYVVLLRDGRVREMWLAQQDQAHVDDFWS